MTLFSVETRSVDTKTVIYIYCHSINRMTFHFSFSVFFRVAFTVMRVCPVLWGVCMRLRESGLCFLGWLPRCSAMLLSPASTSCFTARPRERCLKVRVTLSQQIKMEVKKIVKSYVLYTRWAEICISVLTLVQKINRVDLVLVQFVLWAKSVKLGTDW